MRFRFPFSVGLPRRVLSISFCLFLTLTVYGQIPEPELVVTLTGDLYLGSHLEPKLKTDPAYPFLYLQDFCQETDIFFANLETPLSTKGEIYIEKTFTFRTNPQVIQTITTGGINVVSLANNHIMDYGPEALFETIELLEKHKIHYTGAGSNLATARTPTIIEKKGIKVAFLAYNNTYPLEFNATSTQPGTAPGNTSYITSDVKRACSLADLVIVSFHWSAELLKERKPYQANLAKVAIDAGAHLVVGHHPHVIQGVEKYKHGLIAYSLGNFIFASYSNTVQDALLMQVRLTPSGLKSATFYPLNINNYQIHFCPQPLVGDEAKRVLEELQTLSHPNTILEISPNCAMLSF
jgi:poly-gamma-glutamate synthesis protein (capsule biosynthesis protein)